MVAALFDTNILIDYLNHVPQAYEEVERYHEPFISIVTWMEVLVGTKEEAVARTRSFLGRFEIVNLDDAIGERTIEIRRKHRLKLPDAIIYASADIRSLLLVSRDAKYFVIAGPGIRIPYQL